MAQSQDQVFRLDYGVIFPSRALAALLCLALQAPHLALASQAAKSNPANTLHTAVSAPLAVAGSGTTAAPSEAGTLQVGSPALNSLPTLDLPQPAAIDAAAETPAKLDGAAVDAILLEDPGSVLQAGPGAQNAEDGALPRLQRLSQGVEKLGETALNEGFDGLQAGSSPSDTVRAEVERLKAQVALLRAQGGFREKQGQPVRAPSWLNTAKIPDVEAGIVLGLAVAYGINALVSGYVAPAVFVGIFMTPVIVLWMAIREHADEGPGNFALLAAFTAPIVWGAGLRLGWTSYPKGETSLLFLLNLWLPMTALAGTSIVYRIGARYAAAKRQGLSFLRAALAFRPSFAGALKLALSAAFAYSLFRMRGVDDADVQRLLQKTVQEVQTWASNPYGMPVGIRWAVVPMDKVYQFALDLAVVRGLAWGAWIALSAWMLSPRLPGPVHAAAEGTRNWLLSAADRFLTGRPWSTYFLLAANTAVMALLLEDPGWGKLFAFDAYAPMTYAPQESLIPLWSLSTAFLHAFAHGGLGHFIGNMLALWVFGGMIEKRVGAKRFWLLYLGGLAAGAVGGLGAELPIVGASGAVCALLGAYVIAIFRGSKRAAPGVFPDRTQHPFRAISTELYYNIRGLFLTVLYMMAVSPAVAGVATLAARSVLPGGKDHVAHLSHILGFAVGLALAAAWKLLIPLRPPKAESPKVARELLLGGNENPPAVQ